MQANAPRARCQAAAQPGRLAESPLVPYMFRMSEDRRNADRRAWAAEQAARDAQVQKQRERERKARARSARNAQRKIERLRRELSEAGEISDFEEEFAGSVTERLDKFGAAFANPELGRPGDALSAQQKRVVAAMKRKAKDAKRAAREGDAEDAEAEEPSEPAAPSRPTGFRPRIVK